MHALCSRTGVVSITVSAAVLLALPVMAAGQVPGVDKVVGGVTDSAQSVAPVPVAPALPAPPAKAPAAAPAPAPAAPTPQAAAPSAPRQSATGPAPRAASGSGNASSPRSASAAQSAAEGDRAVRARGASDEPARASQGDSADESGGSDVASAVGELPDDASAETLPFTGLRLALIVMAGIAALAGGLVLRRSASTGRR